MLAKKNKEKETQAEDCKDILETSDTAQENTAGTAEAEDVENALEKVTAELAETKNMLLRTAAEYDNYKKRTEKERAQLSDYIRAQVAKGFVPVADNIARSAQSSPSSPDYTKGLEMIVKQLCEALDKLGLKEIEAAGQPFDPNIHEAVMHIEDENLGENVVAEVLQVGYMLGDTVLRPSMVKVAN